MKNCFSKLPYIKGFCKDFYYVHTAGFFLYVGERHGGKHDDVATVFGHRFRNLADPVMGNDLQVQNEYILLLAFDLF